jgi:hypothetical protein
MIVENVVRIGETFAPFVCIDQLFEFQIINVALIVWQIASGIVPPQNTIGHNTANL